MKRRDLMRERLASRKALWSALISSAHNIDSARAEIEERKRAIFADEKALEESIRDLPVRLANLHTEIETLESACIDPEERLIAALFAGKIPPSVSPERAPMHRFSASMEERIRQEEERDARERSAK